MLVKLRIFDEDRVVFDFSNALPVGGDVENVYFEFVSNIHRVLGASASVFGVSWGSFFGTNGASRLFLRSNVAGNIRLLFLTQVITENKILTTQRHTRDSSRNDKKVEIYGFPYSAFSTQFYKQVKSEPYCCFTAHLSDVLVAADSFSHFESAAHGSDATNTMHVQPIEAQS